MMESYVLTKMSKFLKCNYKIIQPESPSSKQSNVNVNSIRNLRGWSRPPSKQRAFTQTLAHTHHCHDQ